MFGPEGLAGSALSAGGRYETATAAGHRLSGNAEVWQPPRQFVGTIEGWDDALFRAELLRGKDGVVEVQLWASIYGVPAPEVASVERAWRESLGRIFPGAG